MSAGGVQRDTGRKSHLHDMDQYALLQPITRGTWLVEIGAKLARPDSSVVGIFRTHLERFNLGTTARLVGRALWRRLSG